MDHILGSSIHVLACAGTGIQTETAGLQMTADRLGKSQNELIDLSAFNLVCQATVETAKHFHDINWLSKAASVKLSVFKFFLNLSHQIPEFDSFSIHLTVAERVAFTW